MARSTGHLTARPRFVTAAHQQWRRGHPPAGAPHQYHPAAVLTTVGLATWLVLVAYTAPLSVLPDTVDALHAGASGPAWVLSSISLGLSAVLLVAGSLADEYGRRRVFLAGVLGLVPSSVLTALAPNLLWFTAGRILQGAAGAAVLAAGLGLLGPAYPAGPGRVRATATWGASVGAGVAAGPLLSAALTSSVGHQAPYWAIAAVALVIAAGGAVLLQESRSDVRRRLDSAGALTLGVGVALLTAGLVEGRFGWTRAVTLGLLATALLVLAGYTVTALRGSDPMLDLRLLRRPHFAVATGGAMVSGLSSISMASYLPTLMQTVTGMSAVQSAWMLAVWAGTSVVSSLVAGQVAASVHPPRQLALGLTGTGLGFLALLGIDSGTSWPRLLPGLVVAGLGVGLLNAALARLAVASVPADRAAMGSGANNTARYIGSSLGGALVVSIVQTGTGRTPVDAMASGADRALVVAAVLAVFGAGGAMIVGRVRRATDATPEPGR